jgi:hypothetical protein
MPDRLQYPMWQKSYLSAMMEMDSRKIKTKIAAAEDVIHRRMSDSKASSEERQAIHDALNALKFLNR